MHNDGKVVPLKGTADQSSSTPLLRFPVALLQVRDLAVMQLRQNLRVLFDNADDTLFEMADKACDVADQNLFFEAMRDLRLKRKRIECDFIEKLQLTFTDLAQPGRRAPIRGETLLLVENDELERTVAIDTMVDKVFAHEGFALRQLTMRLAELLGRPLEDRENPLAPGMLCECFLQSGRGLGVVITVELIVLKLFEKYVLGNVRQLYTDANQLLAAAGVLPNLAMSPGRRSMDRRAPPAMRAVPGTSAAAAPMAFAQWKGLLEPRRGYFARCGDDSTEVQPIATRDLLRLLSHLQHVVPVQEARVEFDLRDRLKQMLSQINVKKGIRRGLAGVDEDVLNLMALLFETIDSEQRLPPAFKTLIARLQIPLSKVALSDPGLFSRTQHPARRLLNEVANVARGWDEKDATSQDDPLPFIEQIVQRLLDGYADDPTIFSELLAEFLAVSGEQRRRSELLEQRTRDAELGRANAERARLRVEDELNLRLVGKTLPEDVVCLIEEAWSQYLLLVWLKHGEASVQWREGLATLDQLIWSVAPAQEPDFQLRLLECVPELLKALRDGLTRSAFDPFATGDFFARLEVLHLQALQSSTPALDSTWLWVTRPIVLHALGEPQQPSSGIDLTFDDASMLKVDTLLPGTWFAMIVPGGNEIRCKLAALINATGKYLFVNRNGLKVLEMSRLELAACLHRGHAQPLDDSPLFDRALERVRALL